MFRPGYKTSRGAQPRAKQIEVSQTATAIEVAHGISSCRPQPRAELSQAERSEVLPREARPLPKAAGAEGAPELREGFKRKLEATNLGTTQLPRLDAD